MGDMTPRLASRAMHWTDAVLDLQDFLADKPTPAYLVGGAVRDALLGKPLKDIDIATPGNAIQMAREIANHLHADIYPLDVERDAGRVLADTPDGRLIIDVARFRAPTLYDDLVARDFTMNAMACDLHGNLSYLIDPLDGEHDAIIRLIRRCSPASFTSDPIRTLRAVRQSVQFGARIEPETLRDIRVHAPRLNDVSPERVRDEFLKMLALPAAAKALRVADALGLLAVIIPETVPLHDFAQPAPHAFDAWSHTLMVVEHLTAVMAAISPQRTDATAAQFSLGTIVMVLDRYRKRLQTHLAQTWADDRSHRSVLLLGALLHDTGKPSAPEQHTDAGARIADERAVWLRLSSAERERLVRIVRNHAAPLRMGDPTPRDIHRFWRDTGDAGVDVCLLALADHLGRVGPYFEQDAWLSYIERIGLLLNAYYERHDQIVAPPVLVDGNTLKKAFKLKAGPVIGELLTLIREAQAAGEVQSADDALALARAHLDQQAM